MNEQNTQKLFEAFPQLYRGRNLPSSQSSMLWGFECEDGWFDLIWNLSQSIEDEARSRGVKPESKKWPEATQVKQKFGSLRFHLAKHNDATHVLIQQAELASTKICEVCGAPATSIESSRHHVKALCKDHGDELLRNSPATLDTDRLPVLKLLKD